MDMANSGFVTINGAQLHYRIVGPQDTPLIITLHGGRGFGDHHSDFKAYSPLGDVYRVLSFDFRGHGQSSMTEPFTFRQLVDDIDGMRQHFAGKDIAVIIIGGSFGGYLAQQYAIEYASCVSHLVLRGTAPSWHRKPLKTPTPSSSLIGQDEAEALKTLEMRLPRAPCASKDMLVDGVFGAFEDDCEFQLVMFALGPLYTESYDANASLKRNRETVFHAKTHNDLYSEKEKYFDYRPRLKEVTAQTLIVVGEKDWICPPGNVR
ncbi:MAG: hypothetical protein M1834_006269 [Cirrosporium novae-zelandiae]|nr:MAG: hypothetical protein M1834_006269 [Cirrosporium novae-zelandiae]